MNNGYKNFLSSLKILIRLFIVGIIIFLISRFTFLFVYGNIADLSRYWSDVLFSFIVGFKFDIKVLTFGLLPIAILSLTQLVNYRKSIINGFYYRVSLYYGLFLLMLFALISIIDFNFYKFFNTRISVLFFGIVEDDTLAVLKSVWSDYPVILIVLSLIVLSILLYFLLRWLFKFLGLRGTVGMKPLDVRHSTISKNTFINTLTTNGVFSLKTAYADKQNSKINVDIPEMLNRYGFKSANEAVAQYLNRKDIDSVYLANNLLSVTPSDSFLASNPPNVVFVLMESMNSSYFELNTPETNVLGKLEAELPNCYVFRNFLSAGNLTIFSLEGILAGTPLAPISQSVYQNRSLSSSVARPFKDNGYATSFITGGEMGWRSLDKFIYNQYFDNVEGESTLKKLFPDASTCEWGVHDEFTFERIFQILNNAGGKPQFVVGFTISNHTPYETPRSYKQYPLTITEDIKSQLKASPVTAYKNLLAYQYANSCLGQFIEEVRNSPLGENTIVVATGDHTNNQLFEFSDKDLLKRYAIPFILYVPEKYKPKHDVDNQKFGSHKDMFPTIFNLALSDSKYLNTGCNLLSTEKNGNFGIYNYIIAMDSVGCVDFHELPQFYRWESDTSKVLLPIETHANGHLDSLYLKARAYVASMKFYIMNELKSKKVGE